MAGKSPARRSFGGTMSDRLPPSPLGATPRPHLRQQYPKAPEMKHLSSFEMSQSSEGDFDQVKRSTKTSYTILRSQVNDFDTVDTPADMDYAPSPRDSGICSKPVIVLGLIFLLSLVAVGLLYVRFPKSAE